MRKIRLGDLGNQAFKFKSKEDYLTNILLADETDTLVAKTETDNRYLLDISKLSINNQTEKSLIKLTNDEKIELTIKWWGID